MKCFSLLGTLYLLSLLTCGQVIHKEAGVSGADRSKIKLYEHKSASYQNTAPDSAIYFADHGLK